MPVPRIPCTCTFGGYARISPTRHTPCIGFCGGCGGRYQHLHSLCTFLCGDCGGIFSEVAAAFLYDLASLSQAGCSSVTSTVTPYLSLRARVWRLPFCLSLRPSLLSCSSVPSTVNPILLLFSTSAFNRQLVAIFVLAVAFVSRIL